MRLALRLLVFCVLTSHLFAGTTLPTAPKPVTIIRQNDIVHIFTSAIDLNYNGIQESGDRVASWHIVDASTMTTQRTIEFAWAVVNANRPWLASSVDRMFVGVGDSVIAYTATTQAYIGGVFLGPSSGLYYDDANQELYSSHRTSFVDPGVVHVWSLATQSTSDIPVGVNPQQIAGYQSTIKGKGLAIVSEGTFGKSDGTLMLSTDGGQATVITVGDTPNHILVSGDSAYVTVNGSHFVVVVDLNVEAAVDTVLVGTSGFDGPRESAIKDGRLFVSTYAGDVRIFDISTGARVGFIQHGPRAEGLAIVGNTLWVTRAMDVNYAAESGVVVYDLDVATSALTPPLPPLSPLTVTPSVANDVVVIAGATEAEPVRFVNTRGEVTSLPLMSSSGTSMSYAVTALPEGAYIVTQGTKKGRFVVIR